MSIFPTKILVASEGSDESKLAICTAAEIANSTQSELHIVHVGLLSPWVHPDTLSPTQYQRLKDEAQKRLDKEVEYAKSVGAKIAQTHLRMGRVDGEVIRLSEELPAGLVMVGSRGEGTVHRILLGSDSESIVRHAPCPVMVVRKET